MEWLDSHSGSVQAIATLVLVALTGYYAWASRALVRETRSTMAASARATLQSRLDRIQEIMIQNPDLFTMLNDEQSTGDERDARFHVTNMFLAILEEAHTQFAIEHVMTEDDWRAWVATIDAIVSLRYVSALWWRVHDTYEPNFQQFIDARLRQHAS
jgi:hypothetical protein